MAVVVGRISFINSQDTLPTRAVRATPTKTLGAPIRRTVMTADHKPHPVVQIDPNPAVEPDIYMDEIVTRGRSGTVRFIEAHHILDQKYRAPG